MNASRPIDKAIGNIAAAALLTCIALLSVSCQKDRISTEPSPVDNPEELPSPAIRFGVRVEERLEGTGSAVRTFGRPVVDNPWQDSDYMYFLHAELDRDGNVLGGRLGWDSVHLTPDNSVTLVCHTEESLSRDRREGFKVNATSSNGYVQVSRVNDTTFTLTRLQEDEHKSVVTLWTGRKGSAQDDVGCTFTIPVHTHTSVPVEGFRVRFPSGEEERLRLYDYDGDKADKWNLVNKGGIDARVVWRPPLDKCNLYTFDNHREYFGSRKFYGEFELTVEPFYATNDQIVQVLESDLFTFLAEIYPRSEQYAYVASLWEDADTDPESKWITCKGGCRPSDLSRMRLRYTPYTVETKPGSGDMMVLLSVGKGMFAYRTGGRCHALSYKNLEVNAR